MLEGKSMPFNVAANTNHRYAWQKILPQNTFLIYSSSEAKEKVQTISSSPVQQSTPL